MEVRGGTTRHRRYILWPKVIQGVVYWMTFVTLIKHWDANPETGSPFVYKKEYVL